MEDHIVKFVVVNDNDSTKSFFFDGWEKHFATSSRPRKKGTTQENVGRYVVDTTIPQQGLSEYAYIWNNVASAERAIQKFYRLWDGNADWPRTTAPREYTKTSNGERPSYRVIPVSISINR